MSLVELKDVRVELGTTGDDIVDGISLTLEPGEILALVGESGSGKTTLALALLGHARRGARIAGGEVRIDGIDVLALGDAELRAKRGTLVSYVPQDPTAALNPALRIRRQLEETLNTHGIGADPADRADRIRVVLEEMDLPADDAFLHRYPHQLSGGQLQRVAIAMALVCRPRVLVFDEPTTGLDVTTQARVLETVRRVCQTREVAAVYVTHDLAVVAGLAHAVMVMYAGRLVEFGTPDVLFSRAAHPYTQRLVQAVPDIARRRVLEGLPGRAPAPGKRPSGCFFAPRCEYAIDECRAGPPPLVEVEPRHRARCIRTELVLANTRERAEATPHRPRGDATPVLAINGVSASHGSRKIVDDVSFTVGHQECVALVGQSGSGKTTLARTIIGLMPSGAGEISFRGTALAGQARERPLEVRQAVQYIFQSPYASLNPRRTVGQSIATPLEHFFKLRGAAAADAVAHALERVSLSPHLADRYPDELSGGERQRVAIARALACEPEVLICDEITSALDVSVQAAIVELLERLREEERLSILFVTHNLALVRSIADRVLVMNAGRIVEAGLTDVVLDDPKESYTQQLLANTPAFALASNGGSIERAR
jgi:peptide/nickel transport system ATP-binding protein